MADSAKRADPLKPETQEVTLEQFNVLIRKRAYAISQERLKKQVPGDEYSDWLAAEAEIKKKYYIR